MKLRFAEEFYRIERIGNTETNNLVDPVSIQVVLHDEKHIVYAYTSIIFTVIFIWFAHTIVRLLGMKSADKNI